MNEKQVNFAASLISDCNAPSLRDEYIRELMLYLGPKRLHRYGKCGDRQAPPKPFKNTLKLMAQYKL
jgi:hypothetical protein